MTATRYVELRAHAAGVAADQARRTISGTVAPWDVYGHVSTGQRVAFAPGSLTLGDRVKLNMDHDPTQPVGVLQSTSATAAGQVATFRVPGGPEGDTALLHAAEGLRDGLSVGAEIDEADDTDEGIYVRAARVRHVALLSEPAFDDARVSAVAAAAPPPTPGGNPVDTLTTHQGVEPTTVAAGVPTPGGAPGDGGAVTAAPTPPPPSHTPQPVNNLTGDGGTLTPAGHVVAALAQSPVRVVAEAYPYARPHHLGGPSFVLDAFAAIDNPASAGAERWRRAQLMAADAAAGALGHFDATSPATLRAATGTTVANPALAPAHQMPERYVPLLAAKAPLYSILTKYGTPDFNSIAVPRTATETGLSGKPTDEVTPATPGTITNAVDTIVIDEVEGAYEFSRKLLMGSNPQIDQIALAAMDRAWLADVETRATAFFLTAANGTAVSGTYADGQGYTAALRARFAALAAGTLFTATAVVPAAKEYIAAAVADDSSKRPLFPYGPMINSPGTSEAGYEGLMVQGVPLYPGPYMSANKSVILDQSVAAAVAWATPVMNFRLEWTSAGSVKVLRLVKYSGVGFWSQYVGGINVMTNTTPLPLADDDQPAIGAGVYDAEAVPEGEPETAKARK